MPKRIFEQAQVTLNGADIGADLESLELMAGRRNAVDVTGLSDTYEQFLSPNLRRWGVRVNYFNNFDTSSGGGAPGINSVLKGVFNSSQSSGVALTIRATTNIRSGTNPEWTGFVGIDGEFQLMAGSVAEADKGSVALKGLSALTFLTSSSS